MQPASASVRIKRPRAAVHGLLVDLARHEAYLDHFLADWAITSGESRGAGAAATLHAKGGGGAAGIEAVIADVSADAIVLETRGGRRLRRRIRLVYALADIAGDETQVTLTLELLEGSIVDRATWSLPRAHLERQYGQALLRLKGLLESEPRR